MLSVVQGWEHHCETPNMKCEWHVKCQNLDHWWKCPLSSARASPNELEWKRFFQKHETRHLKFLAHDDRTTLKRSTVTSLVLMAYWESESDVFGKSEMGILDTHGASTPRIFNNWPTENRSVETWFKLGFSDLHFHWDSFSQNKSWWDMFCQAVYSQAIPKQTVATQSLLVRQVPPTLPRHVNDILLAASQTRTTACCIKLHFKPWLEIKVFPQHVVQ